MAIPTKVLVLTEFNFPALFKGTISDQLAHWGFWLHLHEVTVVGKNSDTPSTEYVSEVWIPADRILYVQKLAEGKGE